MTRRAGGMALLSAAALALLAAGPAQAHIQVTPQRVAPDDAVIFTVLVPGEKPSAETTRVEVKVPAGVLPYSFAEVPGWNRRLTRAKDNSVATIVWTGTLPADGFVELPFLAATPPEPGELEWKSLQTYSNGEVVRWIGSPDSAEPAPLTVVDAAAPRLNAGGESATGATGPEGAPRTSEAEASSDGADWVARGLALAAVLLAGVAVGILLRRGRKEGS